MSCKACRLFLAVALLATLMATGACSTKSAGPATGAEESSATVAALPDSAYYLNESLPAWVDPTTGYDTTRQWKLDGGDWPILLAMSPSQAPQLIAGWNEGTYADALSPFGINPSIEKLDGPPRVFHALERSKWPIAYVPLAVFMDYVRSPENQGSAGGLQYVAIAGSSAGGGYTLLARDPAIGTVGDLKGKKVGFLNANPLPGTLLTKALEEAGLEPGDVTFTFGESGDQLNKYSAGELDAVVSLNILKAQLLSSGSHAVTDFADVGYTPDYTVLMVERSVLEERPDVVAALLEAHYQGQKLADESWSTTMVSSLRASWNDYFATQDTAWSSQRPIADDAAYAAMLGKMWPEMRLDRSLVDDCFAFNTRHDNWGWEGTVDTKRLVDYEPFNKVLKTHGEKLQ